MTKRIVSLTLSLIMVLSLFTGLSFPAGAEEETAGTYVKVTSTDEIVAGITVVIVCNDFLAEYSTDGEGASYTGTPTGEYAFEIVETQIGGNVFALKHTGNFETPQYLSYGNDSALSFSDEIGANSFWMISVDGNENAQIVPNDNIGSAIAYNGVSFICVANGTNNVAPIQLYKLDTTGGSDEPVDTSEDIQIFFIDETESAGLGYKLTEGDSFPSETQEDLTVVEDKSMTPFLLADGSLNIEAGVEGGKAYTDNGLHSYYKIKVNENQAESHVVVSDGGESDNNYTLFLNFKSGAKTAASGEKYAIYYLYRDNGKLTASAPAADIWPEDKAVETPATCTGDGNITYYGLFTTETKVTMLEALGHDWGEWTTDPSLPGQRSRTCARCGETETALNNGYFLIGKVNGTEGWTVADINPANYFTLSDEGQNEYKLETILAEGDAVKAVYVEDDQIKYWYPDGMDNNYGINADLAGNVTVYLRPNGNGASDWHYNVLYIVRNSKLLNLSPSISLQLESSTALNYKILQSQLVGYSDVKLVVEHYDAEAGIQKKEITSSSISSGRYVFVYDGIAAKRLNDKYVAQIVCTKDGETWASKKWTYNPINYCYTIAAMESYNLDWRKTFANMIAYGAAAQVNFDYNTDNLPTSDSRWATLQTLCDADISNLQNTLRAEALQGATINFTSLKLDLQGTVIMRYILTPGSGLNDVSNLTAKFTFEDINSQNSTVTISGTEWVKNGTKYQCDFSELNAGEWRKIVTAVIVDENDVPVSNTLYSSIEGYVVTALPTADANFKTLLQAMMRFTIEANKVLQK